ncbi:metallophosphoesterase family protein [Propylenella binzhouense]|uniref:Metallophosphoesterase n=1 Tax=Propylenella binzhouense TaxID=2555902 RepID=A0A964T381_9HYPH|nr:metallophosphoesterase [Propylenella binzhouense]MYZ46722.1 metallophosphoesterase [Propylenella binzhouense]
MYRIAHISDVHLGPIPQPRLRQLASKRLVGYANWRRNRANAMTGATLDRLVEDLRAQAPDHIVVTGDLTNIALREEFENARRWLEDLGPPSRVTAVPGNHDAYVPGAHQRFRTLWAPWMVSDDMEHVTEALFPFMRRKGQVALIGLSSARASAPFMATGRVGRRQSEALVELLREARRERLFRVVLIHHPPKLLYSGATLRRLTDGSRLRRVIRREGAELILHGHEHIRSMTSIRGPEGAVPVIGVPAGSAPVVGGPKAGGYALYEIAERDHCFELTVIHRGYEGSATVVETARSHFEVRRR